MGNLAVLWGLLLRHGAASWRMLGVLALGVLVASTLLASAPIYARAMADLGLKFTVRDELRGEPSIRAGIEAQQLATPDSLAVREAVERRIDERLGWFALGRSVVVESARLTIGETGEEPRAGTTLGVLYALEGFERHVSLEEGRLPVPTGPDGPIEVAMGPRAAALARLQVGDSFLLIEELDNCDRIIPQGLQPPASLRSDDVGALQRARRAHRPHLDRERGRLLLGVGQQALRDAERAPGGLGARGAHGRARRCRARRSGRALPGPAPHPSLERLRRRRPARPGQLPAGAGRHHRAQPGPARLPRLRHQPAHGHACCLRAERGLPACAPHDPARSDRGHRALLRGPHLGGRGGAPGGADRAAAGPRVEHGADCRALRAGRARPGPARDPGGALHRRRGDGPARVHARVQRHLRRRAAAGFIRAACLPAGGARRPALHRGAHGARLRGGAARAAGAAPRACASHRRLPPAGTTSMSCWWDSRCWPCGS